MQILCLWFPIHRLTTFKNLGLEKVNGQTAPAEKCNKKFKHRTSISIDIAIWSIDIAIDQTALELTLKNFWLKTNPEELLVREEGVEVVVPQKHGQVIQGNPRGIEGKVKPHDTSNYIEKKKFWSIGKFLRSFREGYRTIFVVQIYLNYKD